ncbi:uncharacterized protein LOC134527180 isoform X2 [Bacillus rossius redtenbacheri]|uniref:uncharacterized protein LOC134527180 isoform X2 n=1 Tax=Bacillus rossius redtenbacheri TaxID=93214 RepID=UPI002FDCC282
MRVARMRVGCSHDTIWLLVEAMKEDRSINEHPVKPEPFETVFLNMKQEMEESEDDADGGWAASCAETVILPVDMSGGGVAVKQEPGSGDDPACEPLGVAVTYTGSSEQMCVEPGSPEDQKDAELSIRLDNHELTPQTGNSFQSSESETLKLSLQMRHK